MERKTVSEIKTKLETLDDVFMHWLATPHPSKPGLTNGERPVTERLSYQRALRAFALGASGGVTDLELVPAESLNVRELLLARFVEEGLSALCARTNKRVPGEKTLKNLISYARALQALFLAEQGIAKPGLSPSELKRSRPKRRARQNFYRRLWPEALKAEWQDYATWKMQPILPPHEERYRKKPCRWVSIDAQAERVNGYVGWFIRVEGRRHLSLLELCDLEAFSRYLNWYLAQDADGGYTTAKMAAVALGTLSQYLVAKGRLAEHTEDGRRLWDVLYEMGRQAMQHGAEKGELPEKREIGSWKPKDLFELGKLAWTTQPVRRQRGNEGRWRNQCMVRRRSALFFLLAYETPLRARNFREMRWRHNLQRLPDGRWEVCFKGNELKVGRRGFHANIYREVYSRELSGYIDAWRDHLAEYFGPDFETVAPYVFPGFARPGAPTTPIQHAAFSRTVSDLCEELRGERFNLHKVRHIVGSYLVNEHGAGGIGLAARLLGDTPKVVMDAYFRPNHQEAFEAYVRARGQDDGAGG